MATYTMQLKTYIEKFSQYDDNLSYRERIEIGRGHLFDFDYPIFDEAYKKIFETNLIRTFYFREIGFETEGAFKFYLETWLNVNMPYFNKLLESELIEYDPLINSEMNVTHELKKDKKQDDDSQAESESEANSKTGEYNQFKYQNNVDTFDRAIKSDTPDSRLQLTTKPMGEGTIEYASGIEEDKHHNKNTGSTIDNKSATGKSDSKGKMKSEYSSNINELEDFVQHRQGKIGVVSYAELLTKYRAALLRIEKMIHSELQNLFMLVY